MALPVAKSLGSIPSRVANSEYTANQNSHAQCLLSSMERASVFGTDDVGSIPTGGTLGVVLGQSDVGVERHTGGVPTSYTRLSHRVLG
jgi:hypothetical protein